MVWFQCEDCGENLKKPKLPNHFRICSAYKLSCIDCGETFGQQSVQSHTQCITEAEKYGPKGLGKASNGSTPTPKPKNDSKQKAVVDINVGLTERAPWFCSLCNTQATSRQALLLHAEGKKHRAKARAFHAANQPAKQKEESTPGSDVLSVNTAEIPKEQDPSTVVMHGHSGDNKNFSSTKKRKTDAPEGDVARKKVGHNTLGEPANREVIHETNHNMPKEEKIVESNSRKKEIKWKKLITKTLKSSPEGVLKMKKLQKLVLKAIQESGITSDEMQLTDVFKHKVCSSSKFAVGGKYVYLVAKD